MSITRVIDNEWIAADENDPRFPAQPTMETLRATRIAAVDAQLSKLMSEGAPVVGGLYVALDDSARADMGAMATTAIAASTGALPWPDSYKQGWISLENARIPLDTPTVGLQLAAGVGDYYAKCRQNGRSLKDALLAATDLPGLNAVDITAGWPAAN